jgi:hypothetical protein
MNIDTPDCWFAQLSALSFQVFKERWRNFLEEAFKSGVSNSNWFEGRMWLFQESAGRTILIRQSAGRIWLLWLDLWAAQSHKKSTFKLINLQIPKNKTETHIFSLKS